MIKNCNILQKIKQKKKLLEVSKPIKPEVNTLNLSTNIRKKTTSTKGTSTQTTKEITTNLTSLALYPIKTVKTPKSLPLPQKSIPEKRVPHSLNLHELFQRFKTLHLDLKNIVDETDQIIWNFKTPRLSVTQDLLS